VATAPTVRVPNAEPARAGAVAEFPKRWAGELRPGVGGGDRETDAAADPRGCGHHEPLERRRRGVEHGGVESPQVFLAGVDAGVPDRDCISGCVYREVASETRRRRRHLYRLVPRLRAWLPPRGEEPGPAPD